MTLSLGDAPLSTQPRSTVNYTIDGPNHRLLLTPFPRRVRATFGGEVVLDTVAGHLLHESNMLPTLYVPEADFTEALLTPTDHSTHCPYKGDAAYWTLAAGGRTATNAVWGYPSPRPEASWLAGHRAVYWDVMDEWFDEDEVVRGHLRDPYHRVDVVRTSRHVVVRTDDVVLGNSVKALVVSETGLPNRYYLPIGDVNRQQLTSSTTRTHCPYKGDATYWSMRDGSVADVGWSYEEPTPATAALRGYVAFVAGPAGISVTVDGVAAEG